MNTTQTNIEVDIKQAMARLQIDLGYLTTLETKLYSEYHPLKGFAQELAFSEVWEKADQVKDTAGLLIKLVTERNHRRHEEMAEEDVARMHREELL